MHSIEKKFMFNVVIGIVVNSCISRCGFSVNLYLEAQLVLLRKRSRKAMKALVWSVGSIVDWCE